MGLGKSLTVLVLAGAAVLGLANRANAGWISGNEGLEFGTAQRVAGFQPSSARSLNYVSPDGQDMLLQVWNPGWSIYSAKQDSSGWGPRDASGNVILKSEGLAQGGASLSPDKQYMYYADGNIGEHRARRNGDGWINEGIVPNLILHPETSYFNGSDIYMSQSGGSIWRAEYHPGDNSFGESSPVSEVNLPGYASYSAWVSENNKLMLFSSNRPGGYGGFDLWSASRNSRSDAWSNITNLGPNVNTAAYEGGPFITELADTHLLYFENGSYPGGDRNIMQSEISSFGIQDDPIMPEPPTLALFASALIGGIGIAALRRRQTASR